MGRKEKVVVVAFDGMDYDLIQEFGLDAVTQEEFGTIDNDTSIKYRYTSELFASFITGETSEEHGAVKLLRSDRNKIIREGVIPDYLIENYRGFWRLNQITEKILTKFMDIDEGDDFKYSKMDLESKTIFDEIELSKPLFVPSYNPDPRWQLGLPHKVSTLRERGRSDVREYSKKLTSSRLNEFYDLSFDFWDFIMLHLHDPDGVQDLELGDYRQDYERLDDIAQEITEKFSDDWTIIFMSDHGLMEEKEHNKNAFYSCNRELFGNETPHITDFYDKVLELTGRL